MPDKLETVMFPVTQTINPTTFNIFFPGAAPAVGMGKSRDAELEQTLLDAVGSYGRQIGRIADALDEIVARVERLEGDDERPTSKAMRDFRDQVSAVLSIKRLRG